MIDQIRRLLSPIQRRITNLVARGVIRAVTDSGKIQTLQLALSADELLGKLERIQQYGFTSVPLPGAEAVAVFPGGSRDSGVVIAVDDRRYRLKGLEGGEVALFTDEGFRLVLKRGGKLEIWNGEHELISVFCEYAQALIDARTVTLAGPQPLLNVANPFPTLKAKLESFKVT